MHFLNVKSKLALLILGIFTTGMALAHDRFILPSHTVLSGDDGQMVSLIASVSNDMFHPDRAFGDNGKGNPSPGMKDFFATLHPQIIGPDGTMDETNIWQAFSRFSAGDIKLENSGTYRVAQVSKPHLITFFQKSDGTRGRISGPDPKVPEGATDVKTYLSSSRVETFVTLNKPTRKALKPTGEGLELGGGSHPNDLFANEEAEFQLYYQGKPLAHPAEIKAVLGGTRHRNQREPIQLKSGDSGKFSLTFPEAGFYLVKATVSFPGEAGSNIEENSASLFLTIEVFPE